MGNLSDYRLFILFLMLIFSCYHEAFPQKVFIVNSTENDPDWLHHDGKGLDDGECFACRKSETQNGKLVCVEPVGCTFRAAIQQATGTAN